MYPFLLKIQLNASYMGQRIQRNKLVKTKEKVEQRVTKNVFKYWKGTSTFYVNIEI